MKQNKHIAQQKADQFAFDSSEGPVKEISGYASVFGVKDSHGDVVIKGAFINSITEMEDRSLKLLSSHDIYDAREILGTIVELKEDDYGLWFKAVISQSVSSQDIATKVREGHLDEVSIGYFPMEEEKVGDGTTLLKEAKLVEISLVTRASNSEAKVLMVKNENNQPNVCKQEEKQMEENNNNEVPEVKAEGVSKEQFDALMSKFEDMQKELSKPQRKTTVEVPEKKEEKIVDENLEHKDMYAFVDYATKKISATEYHGLVGLEQKALQSNVDGNGGVLVPTQLANRIKDERARINRIGNMVEQLQLNGPFELPDYEFAETFGAHQENDSISIDDISSAFGKNRLDPQDFGVIVKVSKRLMRRNQVEPLEGFLSKRYARKFADQLDDHIFTGTGHNQPLGIVQFIDTTETAGGKTVTTTASATLANLDYDNLVDLEMLLDEEYRQGAVFFVAPKAMSAIKKLKDTNNMPIWQRPVSAGQPATLLGYPIFESKSLDNSSLGSAGKTVAIFCDPKEYLLGMEENFKVDVLNELYAATNQVGLKMMASYDGCPLDKNAFGRIETA